MAGTLREVLAERARQEEYMTFRNSWVPLFYNWLIAGLLILLVFSNRKSHVNPYIAVLTCADKASEDRALELLKEKTTKCVCKSKTVRAGQVELNLEVRLKDENTDFVNELSALDGVESAVLVSYNGDYMG